MNASAVKAHYASAGRINLIGDHPTPTVDSDPPVPSQNDHGRDPYQRYGESKSLLYRYRRVCEFGLKEEDAPSQSWARYIFGICREIQNAAAL